MKNKITKKEIITEIFNICKSKNNFEFDNNLIKEVLVKKGSKTNPYDMTKLDSTEKFPEILINENYFIVHLGDGRHKFVKGIKKVFHKFEEIEENEKMSYPYRPSLLNDFSNSESSILSLCFNHRIIHDFLYLDIVSNPKIYNSERKNRIYFEYFIDDLELKYENLQIEIDLTCELNGKVTVFEGKSSQNINDKWLEDFNVFQLYNPFRYYYELQKDKKIDVKKITACYLIRKKTDEGSIIRLYNYIFEDPLNICSLKLLKKREYILKKRVFKDD
jgi:hypothetical protein